MQQIKTSENTPDAISWSNEIARIARQTEMNLKKIEAFDQNPSEFHPSHSLGDTFQTSQSVRPPRVKGVQKRPEHIPSVNNYFLTVPSGQDFQLVDEDKAMNRSRTPTSLKRSNSVTTDMFGRKFSHHRRSVENFQSAQQLSNMNVASFGDEIRHQLNHAKSEINNLQYEFEKKVQKESLRLGIQSQQPLFGNAADATDNTQMFARLEVFEQEITSTLQVLLKAYSSLQNENVKIQKKLTQVVVQPSFQMQSDLVQSQLQDFQSRYNDELQSLTGLVKASRFEVESQILKRIESTLARHQVDQPDVNTFKAEIYEYVQQKIQNVNSTNSQRFKNIHEYLENHTERLKVLGETKTDFDTQFEEFKSSYQLKLKITQESNQQMAHRLNCCEGRIKDQHGYLLRMKKKIADATFNQIPLQRIENIELKLTDEYLENLIGLKTIQTFEEKTLNQNNAITSLESVQRTLTSKIHSLEINEAKRSQNFNQQIQSFNAQFQQISLELPCKVEVLESLIQKMDREFHQMFYDTQYQFQQMKEQIFQQLQAQTSSTTLAQFDQQIQDCKLWSKNLVHEVEHKIFMEQKSLIDLVKQKHAAFDKLLLSLLQQSSRGEDSIIDENKDAQSKDIRAQNDQGFFIPESSPLIKVEKSGKDSQQQQNGTLPNFLATYLKQQEVSSPTGIKPNIPRLNLEQKHVPTATLPFQLTENDAQESSSVDPQLEQMIGNLPTIRTDKDENDPSKVKGETSSGYSIPMVNEQEFNNSDMLETNRSQQQRKRLPRNSDQLDSNQLLSSFLSNMDKSKTGYQLSPSSASLNQDNARNQQDDDDDEPTNPFEQAAGPSSPEVLEISSRYVEEVVSNSDQEEVSKLAQTPIQFNHQNAMSIASNLKQSAFYKPISPQKKPVSPLQKQSKTPVTGPVLSRAIITRETPASLRLKRELRDEDRRKQVCQHLTFDICADLIAKEITDIFKMVRLPEAQKKAKRQLFD